MTLENKLTHKILEEYFHSLNKEKQDMSTVWKQDEEPLTTIYFSIRSPAADPYPSNEHTASLEWQDGATWIEIVWELLKVIEAQYGYPLKEKVFFNVPKLLIQAEEESGDRALAAQMFTKELS